MAPAAKPAASQTATKTATTATTTAGVDPCTRICDVEVRCGKDRTECGARCKPVARVLSSTVVETMVSCFEKKVPPTCEGMSKVVGACLVEATEGHDEETSANVEVFAGAFCDRTQQCGVDGVFVRAQCLGQARSAMRGDPLLGSLRPSSVDRLSTCLKGPCEARKGNAKDELDRCLDALLASAASEP